MRISNWISRLGPSVIAWLAIAALWTANARAGMYLDARVDQTANGGNWAAGPIYAGLKYGTGGGDTDAYSSSMYSVTLGPNAPAQSAGVPAGSDSCYVDLWAIINNPNGLLSSSSSSGSRVANVKLTAAVMGGTGLGADINPVFDNATDVGGPYDGNTPVSQAGFAVLAGTANGNTAGWGVAGFYTLGTGTTDTNNVLGGPGVGSSALIDSVMNPKTKAASTLVPNWLYNTSTGSSDGTHSNANYLQMYLGQIQINIANAISGGSNPIVGMQNGATAYLDLSITSASSGGGAGWEQDGTWTNTSSPGTVTQWAPLTITYDGPTVTGVLRGAWTLSPATSASVGRVLAGGTGSVSLTASNSVAFPESYSLTPASGNLSFSATSGSVGGAGPAAPFTAYLSGGSLGNQSGTFTLTDTNGGSGVTGYTVSGDFVAQRQMTLSTAALGRVLAGGTGSGATTLSTIDPGNGDLTDRSNTDVQVVVGSTTLALTGGVSSAAAVATGVSVGAALGTTSGTATGYATPTTLDTVGEGPYTALNLPWSATVVQSRTASVTSSPIALGRVMQGAAAGGSITLSTVDGAAPDGSDTYNSRAAYSVSGGTLQLTGTAASGALAWTGGVGSMLGNVGAAIPISVASLESPGMGDHPIVTGSASWSADVVANRVVTASSPTNFGLLHVGAAVSGSITLSTTGSDSQYTRVQVGNAGPDANGISVSGGANPLFNGSAVSDQRTLGGIFSTVGSLTGSITLPTTGEGLSGEVPINVPVGYVAQVFSGKAQWSVAGGASWGVNGNWQDTQAGGPNAGAPGLSGFFGDTATFGNVIGSTSASVTLDGSSPLLSAITFNTASGGSYTLAPGSGGTLTLSATSGTAAVTVSNGSQQIAAPVLLASNTNISVSNAASTLLLSGAVSGSGGLTKAGSGTLILSGANTYGGATSVAGGTLNVAGSLGNTAVAVAGGASLGGSGSIAGPVTVNAGGIIQPGGAGTIGTLSVGSLSLNSGSILQYDFGGSNNSLINITGNGGLNLSGGGFDLYQSNGTTQFSTTGTYTLMDYTGSFSGAVGNLSVLNAAVGRNYAFAASGGSLTLTILGPLADTWTGGGSPTFNWSNAANWSTALAPTSGQSLAFAGTTGLSNINDISSLNAAGIVFNSSAGAFTLTGNSLALAGNITNSSTATQTIALGMALTGGNWGINANSGNIVLSGVISDGDASRGISIGGSNTVTLTASNTYSGGTTINAGTLQLGDGTAHNGSLAGNITNNSNLVFANPNVLSYSGVISGASGNVTFNGPGALTLTNTSSYGGTTTLNAGTLTVGANGNLPSTGAVNISGGVLALFANQTLGSTSGLSGNGGTIVLNNGVTLTAYGNNGSSAAAISGSGNFTLGGGTLLQTGALAYSGSTTLNGNALLVLAGFANNLPSGTFLSLTNSAQIDINAGFGPRMQYLSGLSGSTASAIYASQYPGTLDINLSAGTQTYAGNLAIGPYNSVNIIKDGAGTQILSGQFPANPNAASTITVNAGNLTLTGSNQNTGATTIAGGTLQLGNGAASGSINASSGIADNGNLLFRHNDAVSVAPVISGSGNLTQSGAGGKLTLPTAETYSGTTNVSSGTLALGPNGSIANSTLISVAGGAAYDVSAATAGGNALLSGQTLSGAGSVLGALVLNTSATLSPGVAGVGTLSVGSLTLNSGSILQYDFGSGSNGLLNVTGSGGLNLSGGGLDLYQSNGTTQFSTPGTYTLMDYAGSYSGAVGNLSVLNPALSSTYTFTAGSGVVTLNIVGPTGNVTWDGGGSPTFNWSNAANWSTAAAPASGQSLTFAGTTGLSNNNDLSSLNVGGLAFSGSAGAFTLSGNSIALAGNITNSSTATQTIAFNMGLTGGNWGINANSGNIVLSGAISNGDTSRGISIAGSSTVTLTGNNTYSGPTTISSGTLQIGGAGSLGGGSYATAIADNGALVLKTSSNQTLSGAISGSGGLTQAGGGGLTLSGNNTYSGGTSVYNGTLTISGGSSNSGSGGIYVGTGGAAATMNVSGASTALTASGNVTIGQTTAGTLNLNSGTINAMGINFSIGQNALGVLNQTGGSMSVAGTIYLGVNTGGNGVLNQTGGTSTYQSNWMYVGNNGPGSVIVNGPTAVMNLADYVYLGYSGSGTLTLASGTISQTSGSMSIGENSAGVFNLAGGLYNSTGSGMDIGSFAPGVLNQSGGSMSVAGPVFLGNANNGVLNQTGGTSTYQNNSIWIGFEGPGSLTVNGSTALMNLADSVYLGNTAGGTFALVSGTISETAGNMYIGSCATGVFNQTGGLFNFTSGNGAFYLGFTSPGTLNLSGGTLLVPAIGTVSGGTFNFNGGMLQANASSTSFMTGLTAANVQAGGAIVNTGGYNITIGQALLNGTGGGLDGGLTKLGGGVLTLTGSNTYTGGTTVSGGTLQLAAVGALPNGSSTGNLALPGGTLNLAGYAAAVNALSGGGVVTNSGAAQTFTVGNNNAISTFAGTIAGGANLALTKTGSGTLTLTGTSSYTGATSVSGGGLLVNGSLGNTAVAVAGGASLGGSGSIAGAVTVNSGATLLPGGPASIGTLSVGSLTLNSGSILQYDFGSGSNSLINVTGSGGLNLSGGGLDLYQSNGTTQFATPGTYTLMDYAGSYSGAIGNLSVLNPALSTTYTFTASGGSLTLNIVAGAMGPETWTGGGSPSVNWSNGANWTTALAPTSGQSLTFAGTTGLSNNNDLSSLNVGGITFASSAGAFTLSGNSIALSGNITNSSTATQTIAVNLGLTGGNWGINANAGNIVLSGVLSDGDASRGLSIGGSNTVTLTGNNTYSGGTSINNGSTLNISGGSSNSGSGALYVGTGGAAATMNVAGPSTTMAVSGNVGIGQTTAGTFNLSSGTINQTGGSLIVGSTAPGVFNQTGGLYDFSHGAGFYVGNSSAGVFNQLGGSMMIVVPTYVGYSLGGNGVLNQTGGTSTYMDGSMVIGDNGPGSLTVNGPAVLMNISEYAFIGDGYASTPSSGTLTLASGTISQAATIYGMFLGYGTTGVFNQTGGLYSNSGVFDLGLGCLGLYNQTGGSINVGSVYLGAYAGGNGVLNQTGGTSTYVTMNIGPGSLTLNGPAALMNLTGTLYLGSNIGSGTLTLASGTISQASGYVEIGAGSAGVFNQTGGLYDFASSSGPFYLGYSSPGTLNLSGGTLILPAITPGGGSGTFNFNGGMLQAGTSSTSFMTGLTAANVLSGGAIVNTGGYNITIGQALLNGTGGGIDGGLTKLGSGTLTLTGNNTYTGGTSIYAGTLNISGGSSNSGSGGIYIGTGGAAATMNVGGANTAMTMSGNVTIGQTTAGTLTLNNGTINQTSGSMYIGYGATGVFNQTGGLYDFTGTGYFYVGFLSAGTLNLSGGTLIVPAVNSPVGASGTFNFNGGVLQEGSSSTSLMSGLAAANVLSGGAIINPGGYNITIGQALLNGTGGGADGGLTETGSGTLTLTGCNTFTGALNLNGGTLDFAHAYNLGSGTAVNFNGGTLYYLSGNSNGVSGRLVNVGSGGGTINLGSNAVVTLPATLSGSGQLNVAGGSLSYSGTSTAFTGTLNLAGGTFGVASGSNITGLGTATQNNGSNATWNVNGTLGATTLVLAPGNTGTYGTNSGVLNVNAGAAMTAGTMNLANNGSNFAASTAVVTIASGGTLTAATMQLSSQAFDDYGTSSSSINVNGVLNVSNLLGWQSSAAGAANTLYRTINVNPGGALNATTINLSQAGGSNTFYRNLNLSGGTLANLAGTNLTVDSSTAVALSATSTLAVSAGNSLTINGVTSGAGGLLVTGGGTVSLTGSDTFTGPLTIAAGMLQVGGGGSLGGGSYAAGIANNGALVMNTSSNQTFSGAISGSGSLNVGGAGAVTLTGNNVYSGSTSVNNGGTLNISGGSSNCGSGALYVGSGGAAATMNVSGVNTAMTVGGSVTIGQTTAGTLNLSSGTINQTAGGMYLGYGTTGVFNQTGGLCNLSNGVALYVGSSGNGVFNQSGGSIHVGGAVFVGSLGSGVLNQTGGTSTYMNSAMYFGGVSPGSLTVNGNTALMNLGDMVYLGAGVASGSGTLTLASGTISQSAGNISIGDGSTGVFNQTGGLFNFGSSGAFYLGYAGTGTLNLSAGTLIVPAISHGFGSGTFNFNGGMLQANANSTSFMTGLTAADVQAGGAIVNTGGYNIAIAQALQNGTGGGVDGGLTKTGSGTLTLSGSNTYTGPTIVTAGTLNVTGSLAANGSNKVFIADNGTLFGATLTRAVVSGSNTYAGYGSAITDDLGTTADILYGGSTGTHNVSMQWRQRTAADTAAVLASDVLNLSGMTNSGSQTDLFVLQMSYDPFSLTGGTAAEAELAAAGAIQMVSLSGDQWVNAVDLNIGGTPDFMGVGPWTSADTLLGEYGVNTTTHTVWAVLDHNSQFGVVPEPSTWALLGVGVVGLLGWAWRRRKQVSA